MTGSVAIVTELVHNINYRYLYPTLDSAEIQYYLYQLLLAVDYAHSNGELQQIYICICICISYMYKYMIYMCICV